MDDAVAEIKPLPSIATPLLLPRFSRTVPTRFVFEKTQSGRTRLARALLNCGVLSEQDWTGEIGSSTEDGVMRWIGERGGHGLRNLQLNFCLADDIESLGEEGLEYYAPASETLTVFGLRHAVDDIMPFSCCMGYRVLELEAWHKGAGFTVARLALQAMRIVQGYGPEQARYDCECRWEMAVDDALSGGYDENSEAVKKLSDAELESYVEEMSGELSPGDFDKAIPAELLKVGKISMAPVRALQKAALPCQGLSQGLMNDAIRLHEAMAARDKLPVREPRFVNNGDTIPGAVLHWQMEYDPVVRYYDHLIEEFQNVGEFSTMLWLTMFNLGKPDEIKSAVAELDATLRVIAALDAVLGGLHSEKTIPASMTRKPFKGKPLVDILKDDEPEENGETMRFVDQI